MAKIVHRVKKVNLDQEVKSSTTGTCGLRMAQNLLKNPIWSITVNLHDLLTLNMCAIPGKQVWIITHLNLESIRQQDVYYQCCL